MAKFSKFLICMLLLSITYACEKPFDEQEDLIEEHKDEEIPEISDEKDNTEDGNDENRNKPITIELFRNKYFNYAVWVKGYIVGACTKSIKYAEFNPPFTYSSAILLADEPFENNPEKVIAIQLKKGKLRDIFNLVDNPANYGREAAFWGTQNTYLGIPGMKNDIGGYYLYDQPQEP